jgi:hypothetical protein
MKGFMTRNTDFKYLVPDLLGRLNRDLPAVSFFALSQDKTPIQSLPVDDARARIASHQFKWGNASTLPAMFDTAVSHLEKDKISLLITDGIYTPPIADSVLRTQESTDIDNVFVKAALNHMSVACLAFRSAFGDSSHMTVSPYYIFVMGSPQNILAFKTELQNSLATVENHLSFKEFQEQDLGYPARNIFYSIIPYVDNTGAGEPANCPSSDISYRVINHVDMHADPQFWIGLDLTGMPAYLDQGNYIRNNLVVDGLGLTAAITDDLVPAAGFLKKVTDDTDRSLASQCSHFVRIKLTNMRGRDGSFTLSLRKVRPSWVGLYNHDLSKNAESRRDKTFGLNNIFDGMEDAYSEKTTSWFFKDLKIIVNKTE